MDLADVVSGDGWYAWKNSAGTVLDVLRRRMLSDLADRSATTISNEGTQPSDC